MGRIEELLKIFSLKLRSLLTGAGIDFERLQEIRLRTDMPIIVRYDNEEYFIGKDASLIKNQGAAYIVTKAELKETMEYISNYSLYAFEEEVKQGFITIAGGHRVGIAGKVIAEDGKIKTMKHISFINVRLAHQIKGCADFVLPYLCREDSIYHTLIISPPGCGKTTLLRDVIRQLSDGEEFVSTERNNSVQGGCQTALKTAHTGIIRASEMVSAVSLTNSPNLEENGLYTLKRGRKGMHIGVVDERSEIAACYMGNPQNELGIRTDVLDCCPKAKGMMLLIRSMAPAVVAVDEIGLSEDIEAIQYAVGCGCKIIATVHGGTIDEVKNKPLLGELVRRRTFERYIVLSNRGKTGKVEQIFDDRGSKLYAALD